jgi:hypothetical protein
MQLNTDNKEEYMQSDIKKKKKKPKHLFTIYKSKITYVSKVLACQI